MARARDGAASTSAGSVRRSSGDAERSAKEGPSPAGYGPSDLADGADDAQPVRTTPQQGPQPEFLEDPPHRGLVVGAEQARYGAGIQGCLGEGGGLEDVDVPLVEGVHGPDGARPGRGAGRERREVARGGSGEVGAPEQQVAQLLVGARSHVVGERTHEGGGRSGTVPR